MEPLLAQTKTIIDLGAQQGADPLLFDPNYLNIQYFFNVILVFFKWLASIGGGVFEGGTYINKSLFEIIFLFLSVALVAGIVYSFLGIRKIQKAEHARWGELRISALENVTKTEHNRAWREILDRIDSFNESEWRRAILSADAMLENMLDTMGYHGDTIGERLKSIEESDFLTLDKAWEAHKIRNRIAHEGQFILTKREARRAVDLYRQVFEEFHLI